MAPHRCTIVKADGQIERKCLTDPLEEISEDYEYFLNIGKVLRQWHGVTSANFLIAHDSTVLPDLDQSTIVMIVGDEGCRLPIAAAEARLILKCYGARPRHPDRLRWRVASVIDRARHLGEVARWAQAALGLDCKRRRELIAKVHPLPMGYCRQELVPLLPFAERPYLISFAGSIDNQKSARLSRQALADLPKRDARLRMLTALRQLEAELPSGSIDLRLTESFAASLAGAGEGYAQTLMRTKLCICPRGTRLETFRIHEGLRFGCIVIAERLPDVWYLRGAPILQLDDWRELPALVHRLRANGPRMTDLHHRSLAWWREVCSPAGVAAKIAPLLRGKPVREPHGTEESRLETILSPIAAANSAPPAT